MVLVGDGRWSTLDARHLYAHAKTAGYVYQADLRDQLTRTLGVRFGPVTNGVAPIDGIPRSAIDAFSTRRAEILEHLDAVGATSARAAQIATLQTRRPKDQQPDLDAIQAEWHERAARHGLDVDHLHQLLGHARSVGLTDTERAAATATMLGPHGLTGHASSFERRDLIRAWCDAHPQGAGLAELELLSAQMIGREPTLVALRGERWTTTELLACEQSVLDAATTGRGCGIAVVPPTAIDTALAERPTISDEQQAVARSLVTDGDAVSVLVAPAGTGKGYTLGAAHAAWTDAAIAVLGATIAARAAAELRAGTGIPSMTIANLIGQLDSGAALPRNSVLVIDEAGMVGSRQLARLVGHATEQGAKVVLVGDPRQLPEIDAGGLLAGLATRVPVLTLTENRRQREPWERSALSQLRNGSVDRALAAFERHGRIERATTLTDVRARIVDAWARSRTAGEEAIMLAARRDDVRALNELARVAVADRLDGATMVIDAAPYQAGDVVMTLRNNARLDVRNGERGTVLAIDATTRSMTVQMADRAVTLPATYLDAGHVVHGYAMTVHKAQGITVDQAFVLGTDDLYREMGYVAMSRGRNGNHLFVVGERTHDVELHGPSLQHANEANLTAALSTSKAQTMASAQLDPLAALDDRALVAQWRQACEWVAAVPGDRSDQLATHTETMHRLKGSLEQAQHRHEQELRTRRSVKDTLARRDVRGAQTAAEIQRLGSQIDHLTTTIEHAAGLQQRRETMLRQRPDAIAERDALDAEIERRVGITVDAHLSDPAGYIEQRLGARPDGGRHLRTWTIGVEIIERFRLEHDITDDRQVFAGLPEPDDLKIRLDQIERRLDTPNRSLGIRM
jgi:ATP-dependent exoDNAse (exonuclease V) alpha subunit